MRPLDKVITSAVGSALLVTGIQAAINEPRPESYQVIVQRNAFDLKPPPPPVNPADNQPPPPPVNIVFTGITLLSGVKKAYFKIPEAGQPNSFLYPSLAEGERDGTLEVLEIDEKAGAVKVRNAAVPMTLTFDTHGNKTPGTLVAGAMPQAIPVPGGAPRIPPPPGSRQGIPPPVSIPPPSTATAASSGSQLRSIPTRTVRTQPQASQQTYEQSIIMVEMQREISAPDVAAGVLPPLPPTELSGDVAAPPSPGAASDAPPSLPTTTRKSFRRN